MEIKTKYSVKSYYLTLDNEDSPTYWVLWIWDGYDIKLYVRSFWTRWWFHWNCFNFEYFSTFRRVEEQFINPLKCLACCMTNLQTIGSVNTAVGY